MMHVIDYVILRDKRMKKNADREALDQFLMILNESLEHQREAVAFEQKPGAWCVNLSGVPDISSYREGRTENLLKELINQVRVLNTNKLQRRYYKFRMIIRESCPLRDHAHTHNKHHNSVAVVIHIP